MPGYRVRTLCCLLAAACIGPISAAAQPAPLERAHAHNDYQHARPLFSALERGFRSVEADVHLVGGQLLVGHHRDSVTVGRTLESLYLSPLRTYIREHGGRAYPGTQPLTLLIDVKSDSEVTYVVLDSVLRRYADILTIYAGDAVVHGPVLAIVSGERAINTMRHAPVRFAAVDGRLADIERTPSPSRALMPLVSDSWDRITKWKGRGPAPANVRPDLERAVARAHANGQQLRFWGTPDTPAVWQLLHDTRVDLIGADDLDALHDFLRGRRD